MNTSDVWEPMLGVLQCESKGTPPFAETAYCRKLCMAGRKHGIRVVVFSPLWIHWYDQTVNAYMYGNLGWERRKFRLPALAYDRCTYSNINQYRNTIAAITRMIRQAKVTLLGIGLRGKWNIYCSLCKDAALSSILPPTRPFAGTSNLAGELNRFHGELFLKPHGGMHGKSTLHVRCRYHDEEHTNTTEKPSSISDAYLELRGRDSANRSFHRTFSHPKDGLDWIARFIGKRKFIVQPYLSLVTQDGEPFDIRVLMQKNGSGRWSLTGMAARVGQPNSVTSNLHGGGRAVSIVPFLESQFKPSQVQQLLEQLRAYSHYIPYILESCYGRVSEIGLDFGIDRDARLWLLEVNSKPGRSVFQQSGEYEAALKSVENPILYAHHVLVRYLRRVSS